MTDDVVQEFARKLANPMLLVAQKRACIPGSGNLITIIALHVDGTFTEKTSAHQSSHAASCWPKLVVVPGGYFQTFSLGQSDQTFSLGCIYRKGLLYIDMATPFQARSCDIVVA